jgi:hypothetical protein
MEKSIIIDYKEYKCNDESIPLMNEEVIFEIVDKHGRMSYAIANPLDLLGDCINKVWSIVSVEDLSDNIFPDEMVYDDEYYKSMYFPTLEEEEEARKVFENKQNNQ